MFVKFLLLFLFLSYILVCIRIHRLGKMGEGNDKGVVIVSELLGTGGRCSRVVLRFVR